MCVSEDLSPKLLAAIGIIKSDENFRESRPKIMRHNKSEHINSENSREALRFPKKLHRLEKKFRTF